MVYSKNEHKQPI